MSKGFFCVRDHAKSVIKDGFSRRDAAKKWIATEYPKAEDRPAGLRVSRAGDHWRGPAR